MTRLIVMLLLAAFFSYPAHAQEMSPEEQAEAAKEKRQTRLERSLENLGNDDAMFAEQSVFVLERMKEEAVPHLIREITDRSNSDRLRLNAMYTLGRIGPRAKNAVPTLMAFMRHEKEDFRGVAVHALGKIGPDAAEAVPSLIPRLRDPARWIRDGAAWALMHIGTPEAKEAMETYRKDQEARKNDFSRDNIHRQ